MTCASVRRASQRLFSRKRPTIAAFMAWLLRKWANRLDTLPARIDPTLRAQAMPFLRLPGASRLDWDALDRDEVRVHFCATDPIWGDVEACTNLVDLREHVRLLCLATLEMAERPLPADWASVSYNLRLAYAVVDVFVDTDVDGASLWCNPVADFESADAEIASKHLAGTIVFTFIWNAYERAVNSLVSGRGGRGAMGRDLVAGAVFDRLPYMGAMLAAALEQDPSGTDFTAPDMRRMVRLGSLAGISAEHLRQFRNRLTHGQVVKPEPEDWGMDSDYVADHDPGLRRFHANIRLLLSVLQILAIDDLGETAGIEAEGESVLGTTLKALHTVSAQRDIEPPLFALWQGT